MAIVYKEISKNKFKSWLLFAGFVLFLIAISFAIGESLGRGGGLMLLPVVGIFTIFYGIFAFYWGDKIALKTSKAKPIEKKDNERVYRIVENLCITAGLPLTKIYIIEDTALNAFATGRDPDHASIAFTTGILDKLEDKELEGVAAHELSHVGNYDIRLTTMAMILVGVVTVIADILLRVAIHGKVGNGKNAAQAKLLIIVLALMFNIFAPLIATLLHLAISRKRELLADASSVLLTRYPEGLASALEKISKDTEILEVANRGTAHLFIANPLRGKFLAGLFSTHPPIEERIATLKSMQG